MMRICMQGLFTIYFGIYLGILRYDAKILSHFRRVIFGGKFYLIKMSNLATYFLHHTLKTVFLKKDISYYKAFKIQGRKIES